MQVTSLHFKCSLKIGKFHKHSRGRRLSTYDHHTYCWAKLPHPKDIGAPGHPLGQACRRRSSDRSTFRDTKGAWPAGSTKAYSSFSSRRNDVLLQEASEYDPKARWVSGAYMGSMMLTPLHWEHRRWRTGWLTSGTDATASVTSQTRYLMSSVRCTWFKQRPGRVQYFNCWRKDTLVHHVYYMVVTASLHCPTGPLPESYQDQSLRPFWLRARKTNIACVSMSLATEHHSYGVERSRLAYKDLSRTCLQVTPRARAQCPVDWVGL